MTTLMTQRQDILIDHIINTEHDSHLVKCIYCGNKIEHRISEFHEQFHYKSITCSCGKTHRIAVDFLGSGHDSWNSKLDKIIKNHF